MVRSHSAHHPLVHDQPCHPQRRTPPSPVSGAPRRSHDAADTAGIHSGQSSTSTSTSYTTTRSALDGCSTRYESDLLVPRRVTTDRAPENIVQAAAMDRSGGAWPPRTGAIVEPRPIATMRDGIHPRDSSSTQPVEHNAHKTVFDRCAGCVQKRDFVAVTS
jgi:hypothetical protein